jgi:hypothetical protein
MNGKNNRIFATLKKILRGRAEVARWAHNPKVVGSNPAPATTDIDNQIVIIYY